MGQERDLLTTGQAAELLGCSRQHVVDLGDRGELRSTSIGTHRRLWRTDVEVYARRRPRGEMTPDQLGSLWLHRVVAGRVAANPDTTLSLARENARRFLSRGPSSGSARQSSPFAGILKEPERLSVLRAFQQHRARA